MVTQFTHHPLVNVVLSTIRDCGHHISIKHAYPVLASYLITGFCIAVHDTPPWPFFSHTIPHLVCHSVRSSLRFYVAPSTTDQNESCIDFNCYLSFIKAATSRSPFTNSQCDFLEVIVGPVQYHCPERILPFTVQFHSSSFEHHPAAVTTLTQLRCSTRFSSLYD